jgi:type III secretory pathway component EscV
MRVSEIFRRMCDAKPNKIEDIKADEPNGMADTDDARAQLAAVKKESQFDTKRYFLYQLFKHD